MERDGILVLGIGNLLMGDEGAGVHAVRLLEREPMPGVTVVDGGTGGFHLLEYFERDPIVMIDATLDGRPPGTVTVLEPRFASDFPRTLTAHDIGLRDLVEAATLVGRLPAMYVVTVSIANLQPMEAGLSEAVTAALPRVATTVRSLVEQLRSASATVSSERVAGVKPEQPIEGSRSFHVLGSRPPRPGPPCVPCGCQPGDDEQHRRGLGDRLQRLDVIDPELG